MMLYSIVCNTDVHLEEKKTLTLKVHGVFIYNIDISKFQ